MNPDTWAYVLGSLGWALAGSVVTLLVQLVMRTKQRGVPRNERPIHMFGVIIVLMTFTGSLFSLSAQLKAEDNARKLREFVACSARIQSQNVDALDVARETTTDNNEALRELVVAITGVLNPGNPVDQSVIIANLQKYTRTVAESERKRLENPYVQPDTKCVLAD